MGKGHGVREFPVLKGGEALQTGGLQDSTGVERLHGNASGIQNIQQSLQPNTGKAIYHWIRRNAYAWLKPETKDRNK